MLQNRFYIVVLLPQFCNEILRSLQHQIKLIVKMSQKNTVWEFSMLPQEIATNKLLGDRKEFSKMSLPWWVAAAILIGVLLLPSFVSAASFREGIKPETEQTAPSPFVIKGMVVDIADGLPLPGVTVLVPNSSLATVTDAKGCFAFKNLREGTYSLKITYVGYRSQELFDLKVRSSQPITELQIKLQTAEVELASVTVSAQRKQNTEASIVEAQKNSTVVESGVSSQQIARTQDRNASEVIRRVPGISIIEDRFVVVRGLSQRYNNVWINNTAVPSSEADSRAFSFDIIPASQLDNMVVVKSPAPEYPADFTGGFIKIQTKDVPSSTGYSASYSTGVNTETTGRSFLSSPGCGTSGNNNWSIDSKTPLPDQKLTFSYNLRKNLSGGRTFALLSALNYNYTERSITSMESARYSVYDTKNDAPDPVYQYSDNQYTKRRTLGAMVNMTYLPNEKDKYEWKNIFNQIVQNRYTSREGVQFLSGEYRQEKSEYNYTNRTTYSTQFAANFIRPWGKLDAEAGYSYAGKQEPDRRFTNRQENEVPGDAHYGEMEAEPTDISREENKLNEHIFSLGGNFRRELSLGNLQPTFKAGVYGEYRSRDYRNKAYNYQWNRANNLDLGYQNVVTGILSPENLLSGVVYTYDETDKRNSYKGNNLLGAGYLAFNIPIQKLNIYTGVRCEESRMELTNNLTLKGTATSSTVVDELHFFPSVNATYKFSEQQLLRFSYGSSINRPEFREISPSTYYDFDLFSFVKGNASLKSAYVQNLDLRYEIYPGGAGETVSLGVFYKYFKNPIEWTYLDAGGTYTYTFENADAATNYGIELEIKKNLAFIGLEDFTFLFNGALIHSRVQFDGASQEKDRPMQGQSPYLVNTGLFYNNPKSGFSAGVLYNCIGKRIVGVGRVDTSQGGSVNNDIPDAYEMPRNVFDLSISQKLSEHVELKLSCRDILNERVVFKQFPQFYDEQGVLQTRSQVTKSYHQGSNISLAVAVNF